MVAADDDDGATGLKVLVVAFSARNALSQMVDEFVAGMSPLIACRAMVPTNYDGKLPETVLIRVPCGFTRAGGMLAAVSPLAHGRIAAAVWRFRPDVVHLLTGEGYPWAATMVATSTVLRIPVLVTVHDPDPHPGNLFERLNAVFRGPVLRSAALLHLFSQRHRARLAELVPRAHTIVIGHGSLAGPFLRRRRDGVAREKLVLFFGRLQFYKGIDVLCRAMQQLDSDARLVIAGPGALSAKEAELVKGLGSRVELHNRFVDEAEVALLMQRARVVALPYRHATQSSVPGIATAFGVPVVASALGHFVEEVPALGGLLVPPEDPDALAAALSRALAGELIPAKPVPTFAELAPDYRGAYEAARLSLGAA